MGRLSIALFGSVLVLWGAGCGSEVICGEPFPKPVNEFLVTLTTGDEATDMDIHFCYLRKSGGGWNCHNLDSSANNFERGMTETFTVPANPPVEVGDLENLRIKNAGGGFLEYSWDMKALTVEALLEGGSRHLLYEEYWDDSYNLSRNEDYTQTMCGF
jgi:hypothetical protein